MAGDSPTDQSPKLSIRLIGVRPGTSQDAMVSALQRLYKGKEAEEIRRVLSRLPLLLTRSADEAQARKIQKFIEAQGGIVEIAPEAQPTRQSEPQVGPAPAPALAEKPAGAASPGPLPSGVTGRPPGVERRVRPRVHSGLELRPMGTGEILDRAFRLLQQNFWLFFLILLIPEALSFLVEQGVALVVIGGVSQEMSAAALAGGGISALLAFVVFIIIFIWAQGAMIHAVSETYLGHDTTLRASYSAMRPRLGGLMGTMILMWFFVGLGVVLLVIPGVILLVMWLMTDKAVVLEGKKGMGALGRSRELMAARTEPGFWNGPKVKASVIILVCVVVAIGIHLILQIPALVLNVAIPDSLLMHLIKQALSALAGAAATAYASIAMILFYYDIRIRKEGFDLKMMAEYL
jgi:hypothetical protein